MKNNLQKNLIKSILEENIVQFREDAANILKTKTSNRLKQEYINISKNLLSVNESMADYIFRNDYDAGVVGPPGLEPKPTPPPDSVPSGGDEEIVDWPVDYPTEFDPDGDKPNPCEYLPPPCKSNPFNKKTEKAKYDEYEKRRKIYLQHERAYRELVRAWNSYYSKLKQWRQRAADGRNPPGPKPEKPENGPPRDYSPPSYSNILRPEGSGEYA